MSYSRWKASLRTEKDFLSSLLKISKQMVRIAKTASTKEEYQEAIDKFIKSESFTNFSYKVASRMVHSLAKIDAETWRRAADLQTRSGFLYKLLKQNIKNSLEDSIQNQINYNATLIRTMPLNVSQEVVEEIEKDTYKGLRAEVIADLIRDKTNQYSRAKAGLIARTEVSKSQTALTRSRSESLDLKWYVWRTEEDGRVRDSHKNMNDVLVKWSEPPSPEQLIGMKSKGYYHAGEIYNCRCYPEPLVELEDIKWPHKVYANGSISTMKRSDFEKIT